MADSPQPVVHLVLSRAPADCTICALAMYLGVGYEDVLLASQTLAHRRGMYVTQIIQTAANLGIALERHKTVDLESDSGVLVLRQPKAASHAIFLREGLVFEGDGSVWEVDVYLQHTGYKVAELVRRK